MTIQQIIEIPASRQIIVDLPKDVPLGVAKLKLSIPGKAAGKATFTALLGDLYGSLKDSPNFGGDGMDIQRKIRDDAW
jgi:hypothetical protein